MISSSNTLERRHGGGILKGDELIVRTGNESVEKVGMLFYSTSVSLHLPQTIISQPPHIRNALLSLL